MSPVWLPLGLVLLPVLVEPVDPVVFPVDGVAPEPVAELLPEDPLMSLEPLLPEYPLPEDPLIPLDPLLPVLPMELDVMSSLFAFTVLPDPE